MNGRKALVTGAGRGIGRATALALAAEGAQIMGVARTESELAELADQISADYVVESLATAEGCQRVIDETRRRMGSIDILVNNAGIVSDQEKLIWEQDPAVWDETFAVNLQSAFHLTRLATKDMVENRWGRVVMVSSTAGQYGEAQLSAYCVSKSALLGLMRSTALDVAPFNVTCNAVAPGWVRTEMAEDSARAEAEERNVSVDAIWEERAAAYPAQRIVSPKEVAAMITFLCGEDSSAINGQVITIALGGLH